QSGCYRVHRGNAGAASVDGLRARTRSLHSHWRRRADFQLPVVAARLYRAVFHRNLLAGFRRGCVGTSDRLLPEARTTLRSYQRTADRTGGGSQMLKTRIITAVILLAVLLLAIFSGYPLVFTLLV